jgi:hypothetical protein
MAGRTSTNRRKRCKSNSKSKQRKKLNLRKPNGVIGPRVKRVGGEKFAIVCVDPAKHRSEWMMADYFGNLLLERQTLEHYTHRAPLAFRAIMTLPQPSAFAAAVNGFDGQCPCCRRPFADA